MRFSVLCVIASVACGCARPQEDSDITLRGRVVDSIHELSLPRAVVSHGKALAVTGMSGEFEIRVPRPIADSVDLQIRYDDWYAPQLRVHVVAESVQDVGLVRLSFAP